MADQAVGRDYAVSFLRGGALVPVAYKSLTAPAVEQVERVAERPASRPAGPRKVPTLSETIESNAWDGIIGKMRFQVSSGRIYLAWDFSS